MSRLITLSLILSVLASSSLVAAMPPAAEIAAAEAVLSDLSGEGGGAKFELMAQEMGSAAEKFAVLRKALELYLSEKNYEAADAVANRICREFELNFQEMAKFVPSKQLSHLPVFSCCVAAETELYGIARAFKQGTVADRSVAYAKAAECCVLMGKWKEAEKYWSRAGVELPDNEVACGDFFWNYKPTHRAKWQLSKKLSTACRARAIEIYQAAISAGQVTGLKAQLLNQRIGESVPEENVSESMAGVEPIHRWSFEKDLTDSIGGRDAASYGTVKIENGGVATLGTGYVELPGQDIMPFDGTPCTLEIWAKTITPKNWSRVFDIVYGADSDRLAYASWSAGMDITQHSFGTIGRNRGTDKMAVTLSPRTEYHFAYVIVGKDADGRYRVIYEVRDARKGTVLYTHDETVGPFSQNLSARAIFLGHSRYEHDVNADAVYEEVRIWKRALSKMELTKSCKEGPGRLPRLKSVANPLEGRGTGICDKSAFPVPKDSREAVQSIIDNMRPIPGKNYYVSATELTQAQFDALRNSDEPRWIIGKMLPAAVKVVWMQDYLRDLNKRPEVKNSGFVFRLPREDEWNAVVGTHKGSPEKYAWLRETTKTGLHDVACLAPNNFGLYDMEGNASELVDNGRNDSQTFLGTRINSSERKTVLKRLDRKPPMSVRLFAEKVK